MIKLGSFLLCGLLLLGIDLRTVLLSRLPRKFNSSKTCGYQACPKSDLKKLNIHLLPHSNNDIGWIKTVDQYYFGERNDFQLAGVQFIIDGVIDSLLHDPQRKFLYAGIAYLWRWWIDQNEERKEIAKKLINEGRLVIEGGGWSMIDEAVTHYHSMIDQYTWSFRRLNDTFGSCARPKIGWQIDPFGHSREQASMFAQMGFDGLLFSRLDYQDRSNRITTKTTEFIWRGSSSLGTYADLFVSILFNGYSSPKNYCFDITCRDEPIIDDVNSPDYNIERKIQAFLIFVSKLAEHIRTKNVILLMGGNYHYMNAEMYFKNIDKLIRYINLRNGSNYNAFYSSPSCYIKAVNEQNLSWSNKTDDFFPYASEPHAYWTGFFSTRPAFKLFERIANNFLQILKQLSVLSNAPDRLELQQFREVMGVMQHHDAITGTNRQNVANDYTRILHRSFVNAEKIASEALQKLLTKNKNSSSGEFYSCLPLNISSCNYTSDNSIFIVTIYNPTSQPLTTFLRLPVKNSSYIVKDFNGKEIITQFIPIPYLVQKIPGRFSKATMELVFRVLNLSPFNYQSFYVTQNKKFSNSESYTFETNERTIGGEFYNISIDSGGKVIVESLKDAINFEQSFYYYESMKGNNKAVDKRSSGAYIFRPAQNDAKNINDSGVYKTFKGPIVEEIHQVINDWVGQVIRIYNGKNYVEFDWLIGPIPVNDKIGKEIITRYSSTLKNNGEFFTDSNGREMIKRKLNFRPTYKIQLQEKVSGNYYPITTKIYIKDQKDKTTFSVLTDRPQGGSSLKDGAIELMIHRTTSNDDGLGIGEPLNEKEYGKGLVVRGQHYIFADNMEIVDESILQQKELTNILSLRPWIFITPFSKSFEEWNKHYNMKGENKINRLPKNIRILTLEPWKHGEILLRIENFFEKDESKKYSISVDIDIKELLIGLNVLSVRETTLGANQWKDEMQRLKWQSETNEVKHNDDVNNGNSSSAKDKIIVRLSPMQIRTFIIKLSQ